MKPKYSPELVEQICKYVREGNSHKDSAALVGISQETFYNWTRPTQKDGTPNPFYHADFSEKLTRAELEQKRRNILMIQKAAAGDAKRAIAGDWRAAGWMLERKYPQEFSEKRILEHIGAGGGPIKTQELTVPTLPPEIMKRLASMIVPEANGPSNGHPVTDPVAGAGV